jgi:glycine cleavage system regulatory protein
MTTDLPEDLRSLDARLAATFAPDAPPADLAARVANSLRAQSRLRLSPAALRPALKPAAAAAAVALLAAAGYVADSRINPPPRAYLGHSGGDEPALRGSTTGEFGRRAEPYAGTQDAFYARKNVSEPGFTADDKDANMASADEARLLAQRQPDSNEAANGIAAKAEPIDGARRKQQWDTILSSPAASPVPAARRDAHFHPASGPKGASDGSGIAGAAAPTPTAAPAAAAGLRDAIETSQSSKKPADGSGGGGAGNRREDDRAAFAQAAAEEAIAKTRERNAHEDAQNKNAPAAPAAPPPTTTEQPAVFARKVIRSGNVTFEVDSFDSALMTVTKLVLEDGGFVAGTESAKLPNGKTRGVVTVRVPPDRLDALVLKLRGLGDLKGQNITAQDVSKQYADNDSALRAARAMEERLLEIIKTSKGAIKDLLAAEKELGVWRGKIEAAEGQKRYYDNLIGLSTLAITLEERDIKAAAGSVESETIDAGVETPEVEWARGQLIEAVEAAKGRVVASDLKKLDGGQLAANVTAEVPPEAAGAIVDRLRQFGSVARLDAQRKTTAVDGTTPPTPGAQVTKRPTTLRVSLYNLANVAPRLTQTTTLAADDVEKAYGNLLTAVEQAGGRVVRSGLTRPQPDTTAATLELEAPSAKAAAVAALLAAAGEVTNLQLSENPDAANVTTAKQGFVVRLVAAAGIPPRETMVLQIAAADVPAARDALTAAVNKAGGRVITAGLQQGNAHDTNATLAADVPRAAEAEVRAALASAGDVLSRQISRSSDAQNTLDTKLRLNLTLLPAGNLPAKTTTTATVLLGAPERDAALIADQVVRDGGRVLDRQVTRPTGGGQSARLALDVPRDKADGVLASLRAAGDVSALSTHTNAQAPEGPLARARFDVTFAEPAGLGPADAGVWASIRSGITTSLRGLAWSLQLIVIGVCLVLPWALLLWLGTRLYRRLRARRAAGA